MGLSLDHSRTVNQPEKQSQLAAAALSSFLRLSDTGLDCRGPDNRSLKDYNPSTAACSFPGRQGAEHEQYETEMKTASDSV